MRPVAVVDVEIDDGNALGAVLGTGIMGCDRRIRKEAEPHGAIGFCVMSGGANGAKGVGIGAGHDAIDRLEAGAHGAKGCFPRAP